MPNPLDPIWSAHQTGLNALKVVRRCMLVPDVNLQRAFGNTLFRARSVTDCGDLLDAAEQQLEEGVVVALYARFEAHVRDHLVAQAGLLSAATRPDAEFGAGLATLFGASCTRIKMDKIVDLFAHTAGQAVIADVGTIRVYRHWFAHGKAWNPPPTIAPRFAFEALTRFLTAGGLV